MGESDESALLSRILDEFSASVIDISVLNGHNAVLEPHEVRERQNLYIKRLERVGQGLVEKHRRMQEAQQPLISLATETQQPPGPETVTQSETGAGGGGGDDTDGDAEDSGDT